MLRTLLSIVLLTIPFAQAQVRPAFRAASTTRAIPDNLRDRGVKRVRAVNVDTALFDRAAAGRFTQPFRTSMSFFDDVTLSVLWNGVGQTDDAQGQVWTGTVDGFALGHAVMVVSGAAVTGNISTADGRLFQIRATEDGNHWVREIDQHLFPAEAPPIRPVDSPAAATPPAAAGAVPDDGSTIDVMVVYTPAVTAKAGSATAAQQLVQLGVAETNLGYQNSGVVQRIRLVYSGEVQYNETGSFDTDLNRLQSTSDGYMDSVHNLRDTYGADVVSLWVHSGDACGLGYLLTNPQQPAPAYAFSVVLDSCATGYFSFGHEMGHNMGATHARDDNTGPGAYAYSYGYKNSTGPNPFRTIMAYDTNCTTCTRVNYWSNPTASVNGRPAGIDPNAGDAAANFLTLNNTRAMIANYRTSQNPGGGGGGTKIAAKMLSPAPGSTLTSSSATFRWDSGSTGEQYFLAIGNSVGAGDLYQQDQQLNQTVTVSGLPTDGRTLYVRLLTRFGGNWLNNDYTYAAFKAGAPSAMPQIVVTSLTVPTVGTAGVNLQGMRAVFANQGTANAATFRVGFYYSRSRNVTTSDVFSGWFCTLANGLAAGSNYTCSGELGVPATLTAGTWYLAAIADDQNKLQQSDRSGNVRVADSGPIAIAAPAGGALPESDHPYASNFDHIWTYNTPGNPAAVKVTFSAQTSVEDGYDFIAIYDYTGNQIPGSPFTGTELANRTVVVSGSSVRIRLATDSDTTDYGFRVTSIADAGALPRLMVTSLSAPTSAVAGVTLQGMHVSVTNTGNAPAAPFNIGFYFGQGQRISTADTNSGWGCSVDKGLAPGETYNCGGQVGVPSLAPGTWYMAAIADDQFAVDQSDRSGNVRVNDQGATLVYASDRQLDVRTATDVGAPVTGESSRVNSRVK